MVLSYKSCTGFGRRYPRRWFRASTREAQHAGIDHWHAEKTTGLSLITGLDQLLQGNADGRTLAQQSLQPALTRRRGRQRRKALEQMQ